MCQLLFDQGTVPHSDDFVVELLTREEGAFNVDGKAVIAPHGVQSDARGHPRRKGLLLFVFLFGGLRRGDQFLAVKPARRTNDVGRPNGAAIAATRHGSKFQTEIGGAPAVAATGGVFFLWIRHEWSPYDFSFKFFNTSNGFSLVPGVHPHLFLFRLPPH